MEKIIEFRKYPLDMILDKLLLDKTTGKRIIWATDGYSEYGEKYYDRYEITSGALIGINPVLIQPRAFKALETQQQRTKSKAEVFTPSWIVNKMVNHLDEEWFGRSDVFNIADNQTWQSKTEKIDFGKKKWKDYVDRTVLEITCGEAPFIVSRYNASTGEIIPIEDRIGILDRKLRVVTENTDNEEDWVKWAQRAFESVYGYEYQGDNLLIGRINLLMTFVDYYQHIWGKEVGKKLLTTITNIITWNFWQMDGLNGTVPLGVPQPMVEQMTLFDIEEEKEEKAPLCKVRQWRAKKTILYKEIEMKEGKNMGKKKWDIVIGNPPYQQEADTEAAKNNGQKRSRSVFQLFQKEADKIATDCSVLIYPGGRWIHQSGKGMASFGKEQMNSPQLSEIIFYPNSSEVFGSSVAVGDGISIVVKDYKKDKYGFDFKRIDKGNISSFTYLEKPGDNLIPLDPKNKIIVDKIDEVVARNGFTFLHDSVLPQKLFGIESNFATEHSDSIRPWSPDSQLDSKTEIKLYTNDKAGKAGRTKWFITDKDNIQNGLEYLDKWKVVVSSANAGGQKRDNQLEVLDNKSAFGRSRVALKTFNTEKEARSFEKYMKSYFIRFALLMTDESLTSFAKAVPDLGDYTDGNQRIDFDKDIDAQLSNIFGLSADEEKHIHDYVENWRK